MPKARTKTGHISVLAKCFSLFLLLVNAERTSCMELQGLPEWLSPVAERGLSAVWNEIPDDEGTDREKTLEIVAGRLFSGYNVTVKPGPVVIFENAEPLSRPGVIMMMPDLRGETRSWFSADISPLSSEIAEIVSSIPSGALLWADEALRERAGHEINRCVPGWDFAQQIYISHSSSAVRYTFRPSSDMILALKPEINSRTIPVMFRSDLEARLIPELSMLIGLPVKWAMKHEAQIEGIASKFLEDRHAVENMKAQVSVKFHAGRISGIEASADSKDLMFSVWVSAYAGLEDRYPEAGIFFGYRPLWRVDGGYNLAPEVYTELIFTLDDFGFSQRIGGRFELMGNVWAGMEYEFVEGECFARLEYIPLKMKRPYGRMRWGMSSSQYELGIGYRFDEHISAEILYYDGSIGVRGMWNL